MVKDCKIALCVKLIIGVCFCTNNFSSYPLPLTYVVHRVERSFKVEVKGH